MGNDSRFGRDGAASSADCFTELKTTTVPLDAPVVPRPSGDRP